jgi:hypothetical protein
VVNEVHIVNDLNTGGTEDVLSAEQGKNLMLSIESVFSQPARTTIIQLLKKAVYKDDDVEDLLEELEESLLFKDVTYITANFSQPIEEIYPGQDLSILRQYLVVNAYYNDSTSSVVASYSLSGTLTSGTSVITVLYGGKSTTFTVLVADVLFYKDGSLLFPRTGLISNAGNAGTPYVYDGINQVYTRTGTGTYVKRACYAFFDLRYEPSGQIKIEVYCDNLSSYMGDLFIGVPFYNSSFATDGENNTNGNHNDDIVDSGWLPATKENDYFYVYYDTSALGNYVGFRVALKTQEEGEDVDWPSLLTFDKLVVRDVND